MEKKNLDQSCLPDIESLDEFDVDFHHLFCRLGV